MKIYVAHSRAFNFQEDLYLPLQEALTQNNQLILPHADTDAPYQSQKLFSDRACDIVLAEVSHSSIGLGIELGWASAAEIPIYAVHLTTVKVSDSLKAVVTRIVVYRDTGHLKSVVKALVEGITKR